MTKITCSDCKNNCCIGEYSTFVTFRDVQRISKATNMKPEKFAEYNFISCNKKIQEKLMKKKNHSYFEYCNNGKILQLKSKNSSLACIFVKDNSCTIYAVRPLLCRLCPLGFRKINGKIKFIIEEEDDDCPVTKEKSIRKILDFIGLNQEQAMKIVKLFLDEVDEYKKYSKHLEQKSISEVLKIIPKN